MNNKYLGYSPEVAEAKQDGRPVVALESTIITHGMPYPQNLETAMAVEEIIRKEGAVPATIAISGGKVRIGHNAEELEKLAKSPDAIKVSRRDLPYVVSSGKTGATTVAATMIAAHLSGIRVFVTGGIGGVHRDGERTMDISADLNELARTPVAVVSAGAKSILDIGRTLEYLETCGVPVVGLATDEFPAFYTRRSGHRVNFRLDTAEEVAEFLFTKWDMGLEGGVLVANPVPERDQLEPELVERIVGEALQRAEERGITGKDLTPFLLGEIVALTGGRSLETNIALVRHNALQGAKIAIALQKIS